MDYKLKEFIENSFLKELINKESITDISFNGEDIFYMDNLEGRKKSNIKIKNEEAKDFIRQISNLSEKPFSFQNPYLDINVEKYRIFAVHDSIARNRFSNVITFSIRIANERNILVDNNSFFSKEVRDFLDLLILNQVSIVISGETSSGKTALQRYLISRMKVNSRIIIIDNILELDSLNKNEKLDIINWKSDDEIKPSSTKELIKAALRNNPDWLIVAEARGEEMLDVLNARMSGHPIITTLHSLDANSTPNRIAMLIMLNDKKFNYENVLFDIYYHFPIIIHLKKYIDSKGIIKREVSSILEVLHDGSFNYIYSKTGNIVTYGNISNYLYKNLQFLPKNAENNPFFKGDYHE